MWHLISLPGCHAFMLCDRYLHWNLMFRLHTMLNLVCDDAHIVCTKLILRNYLFKLIFYIIQLHQIDDFLRHFMFCTQTILFEQTCFQKIFRTFSGFYWDIITMNSMRINKHIKRINFQQSDCCSSYVFACVELLFRWNQRCGIEMNCTWNFM